MNMPSLHKHKEFASGKFVISLDYELMWGVRDKRTVESYGQNILGVQKVIPALLNLFKTYNIKATFSTVGFLFYDNKKDLLQNIPAIKPAYTNQNLSPYPVLETIGENEQLDKYHYGLSLLNMIKADGNHEIGTHTFCHYYCVEDGQTVDAFREDLKAAFKAASDKKIIIKSLVFPRNQYNPDYLRVCHEAGLTSFRGNPSSWLYEPKKKNDESLIRRSLRLADAYINISGQHCYDATTIAASVPYNVAGTRFLRPFSKKLKILDGLRLRRIKKGMFYAAKNKKLYHLWWHPHNFGVNLKENIDFLESILMYYIQLNKTYGFESCTMTGIAEQISGK
jgi:peptidoglycan/xylan/chitin deacetylase (PgdA/CDA1 family)